MIGVYDSGERAGSGADTIVRGWGFNHWPKPQIREKHDPDRVELTLMTGGKNQDSTSPKINPKTILKKDRKHTKR